MRRQETSIHPNGGSHKLEEKKGPRIKNAGSKKKAKKGKKKGRGLKGRVG